MKNIIAIAITICLIFFIFGPANVGLFLGRAGHLFGVSLVSFFKAMIIGIIG